MLGIDRQHDRLQHRLQGVVQIGLAATLFLPLLQGIPAHALFFRVDQLGYHSKGPKTVILEQVPAETATKPGLKIVLVGPPDRKDKLLRKKEKVLFENFEIRRFRDKAAIGPATETWIIDFSSFETPGSFTLKVEGKENEAETVSEPVKISDFLYWDTLKPLMRSLYLHRCGIALKDPNTGLFHGTCHLNDANILSAGSNEDLEDLPQLDATGGWHWSGDYHKYTTLTSLTAAKLLALYDLSPKTFQYFTIDYPVSEENAGILPDLLHETQAGLSWLLSMQRNDGAFYEKVAGLSTVGIVRPDDDSQSRFIFPTTSYDTAASAAVLATASRTYKKKELAFAVKALIAAEKGWQFLMKPAVQRKLVYREVAETLSAPGVSLGITNDMPYRVWAAAELFISTRKPEYHQYFLKHYREVPFEAISPQNPALIGFLDYLSNVHDDRDSEATVYLRDKLYQLADGLRQQITKSPYHLSIRSFQKNSLLTLTEQEAVLLSAYQQFSEEGFLRSAISGLRFLFGMNPLNKTFITGVGSNPVRSPAHRWLQASRKSLPGLVVSGPNAAAQDGITPKGQGTPQGIQSYRDDVGATESNSPSILQNASLAYVLGALNVWLNTPLTPTGAR